MLLTNKQMNAMIEKVETLETTIRPDEITDIRYAVKTIKLLIELNKNSVDGILQHHKALDTLLTIRSIEKAIDTAEICTKCDGTGGVASNKVFGSMLGAIDECPECNGTGEKVG